MTWSRLQRNDVTTIFEKRVARTNVLEKYTFCGSRERREAKRNVMSLADVSLAVSEMTWACIDVKSSLTSTVYIEI